MDENKGCEKIACTHAGIGLSNEDAEALIFKEKENYEKWYTSSVEEPIRISASYYNKIKSSMVSP